MNIVNAIYVKSLRIITSWFLKMLSKKKETILDQGNEFTKNAPFDCNGFASSIVVGISDQFGKKLNSSLKSLKNGRVCLRLDVAFGITRELPGFSKQILEGWD